jgi:hypothetical protein
MTAWSHLPNAKHIDQVLADLKSHPDEFAAAYDAARYAAGYAVWNAAWVADWSAAARAARNAAWDTAGGAAWDAAVVAIASLIAWDHSAKYLTMTYQELGMWAVLSEDQAASLLLTYVRARELIAQKIRT